MGICKVNINGNKLEYDDTTTYADLAKEFADTADGDIILAYSNGLLRELNKTLDEKCTVSFVTTKSVVGMDTYVRGLIMLMMKSFYDVLDKEKIRKISVEISLGRALYCEFDADYTLDEQLLNKVKSSMIRMVEEDLPFKKRAIKTRKAVELFHKYRMYDKEKLFKYRRVSNTNVYELAGFVDYFYGYMPPSTGMLKAFDLKLYNEGFVLILPELANPDKVAEFVDSPKLFAIQNEGNKWASALGLDCVGNLNEQICKGNVGDLILVQEALMEKRIGDIAEQIRERKGVKFVMIAGPSSSGKTSFSHRLSIQLRTLGFNPHPIALDNYFKNREDTPLDEDGNYNFECLEAIDVEGFNRDMSALLNGETVEMPTFNFKAGKREYKGNTMKLNEGDILVIEGIHGLNDKLSYSLPKESKFKIYISALTQINIDEHNRIPTTMGRLIRRMVRDARTRGTSAQGTIAMWPSVRRGEEENIFPFQEEADCMFNSALVYELAVLKQYAEPLLFGIPESAPEYQEAKKLLKFLEYFLGISSEEIPHNSIVREFVGGSVFPV
ncbi:MAG: nucleoside kinase [Lachnospiraceae bacterium]|nr:nucleoside kinase [Lachnospiraceae bacterium]